MTHTVEALTAALREIASLATQDANISAPLAGKILRQIELMARRAIG